MANVISLTAGEYNAIMEARDMIFTEELDNILEAITAFDEDIMANNLFASILEDGEENAENKDSGNNAEASDNGGENKKESLLNKAKEVAGNFAEKVKEIVGIIVKFVTKLIPKVFGKAKDFLNTYITKTTVKDCVVKDIKENTHKAITLITEINNTDDKDKIKEINSTLGSIRDSIVKGDEEYINITKVPKGTKVANIQKVFGKLLKITDQISKELDNDKANLEKLAEDGEAMKDQNKALITGLKISAYTNATAIMKESTKMIVENLKAIKSALVSEEKKEENKEEKEEV